MMSVHGKDQAFVIRAVVATERVTGAFLQSKMGKSRGERRSDINDSEFWPPMRPRASIVAQNAIHLAGGVTDNRGANFPDPKS